MKKLLIITGLLVVSLLVVLGSSAIAGQGGGSNTSATLTGFEEVPAISTAGRGSFSAQIASDKITFTLTYSGLEAAPSVAHIHFGQRSVAGDVIAFLCGGGSKPACPASPGTVTGTINNTTDIVGPTGQGIAPGEFAEAVAAIRAGVAYVNVHSAKFPNGEIRGQIGGRNGNHGVGVGDNENHGNNDNHGDHAKNGDNDDD